MWFVVPDDFEVPEPFHRKEFEGGLFASIPARLSNIGERWHELWDWIMNNKKYEVDWKPETDRRWLEECIDYIHFNSNESSEDDQQLDLLAPVKLKIADNPST